MSALAAAAAPVVVVAVVANSISGVDSDIYIVMITMTGPCREGCTVSIWLLDDRHRLSLKPLITTSETKGSCIVHVSQTDCSRGSHVRSKRN
jgi:hypothetical protein